MWETRNKNRTIYSVMKLLLENWRKYLNEDVGRRIPQTLEQEINEPLTESEKIADSLIAEFEGEQLNEELLTLAVVAAKVVLPFLIKMIGGTALSAAIAKAGAWWSRKVGNLDAEQRLLKLGGLLEQITKIMTTGGLFAGLKKITNWYFKRNPDRQARRKWMLRLEITEKFFVLGVLLTISGSEIYEAAGEGGSLRQGMTRIFQQAGLEDDSARSALIDALDIAMDSGGAVDSAQSAVLNKQMFWGHLKRTLKTLWSGARS